MQHKSWTFKWTIGSSHGIFYGWWIVGVGFVAGVIQTALFALGFGAFFLPIAQELKITRAALSGAFSAVRFEGGVLGPIAGYLVGRVGSGRMMMLGFFIFGGGLILTSRVNSLYQFYWAFLLTGAGVYLCWYIPTTTAVINWFARFRARALSLVLMGSVAGGPLIPILAWSIESFGWRATLVGSGIFVWMVGLPLSLIMRSRPEDYGQYPYGEAPDQSPDSTSVTYETRAPHSLKSSQELSLAQALRTSTFWYLATAHSISLLAWGSVSVHMIPAMVDIGLSEQIAATMVGVMMAIAVLGRLAAGFLSDLVGTKLSLMAAFILQTLALLLLGFATNLALVVLYAIFMGLGYGARGTLLVSFRSELFGRRSYATITGVIEPILTIGFVVGPLLAGLIYDVRGSYQWAFLSLAVINFVGLFFLIPIAVPDSPLKIRRLVS